MHAPQDEAGDDGGVLALGILAGTEDVEVPEPHGIHAEEPAPHGRVQLTRHLGRRIGRDGGHGLLLALREIGPLAVHGGRGGVHDAGLPLLPGRGHEQVERARDVGGVGAERVGDRARDGAHGRLVEDGRHAAHGPLDGLEAREIAADHLEPAIALGEGEVAPAPRGEVVEHADAVPLGEQALDDMGADEAGATGDQIERGRRHDEARLW